MKKLLLFFLITYFCFADFYYMWCDSNYYVPSYYSNLQCTNYGIHDPGGTSHYVIDYCDNYFTDVGTYPNNEVKYYVKVTCDFGYILNPNHTVNNNSCNLYNDLCIVDTCSQNELHNPDNFEECCEINVDQCHCPAGEVIGADSECYSNCPPIPDSNPSFYTPPANYVLFSSIDNAQACADEASNYPLNSSEFRSETSGNCSYYACFINTNDPCDEYPPPEDNNPNPDIWTFDSMVTNSILCSAKVNYYDIVDSLTVAIQPNCQESDYLYCYLKYVDVNDTPPDDPIYCTDCPLGYAPTNDYQCYNISNPTIVVPCNVDQNETQPPYQPPISEPPAPEEIPEALLEGIGDALEGLQDLIEEQTEEQNQNDQETQDKIDDMNQNLGEKIDDMSDDLGDKIDTTNEKLEDIKDILQENPDDQTINNALDSELNDLNTSVNMSSLDETLTQINDSMSLYSLMLENIATAFSNFESDFNTTYQSYSNLMSTIDNNLTNLFSSYGTVDTCSKTFTFDPGFNAPIDIQIDPCIIVKDYRDYFYLLFWVLFNVLFFSFAWSAIMRVL
jgi:hypothetical protein